jgi:hypothetical protein
MTQVIQANMLDLYAVQQQFNLREIRDRTFFWEWQQPLPDLTEAEQLWLDQVKTDFLERSTHPVHEEVVKMFVVAPLLALAGLARLPFGLKAEHQVEIALEDSDPVIRGKVDLLVLHQDLWAIVIESKREPLNVTIALPQALTYMMNSPNQAQPTYGLVTNGSEFRFVKLIKDEPSQKVQQSQYGMSDLFTLQRFDNDLSGVLQVLKKLRDLVILG